MFLTVVVFDQEEHETTIHYLESPGSEAPTEQWIWKRVYVETYSDTELADGSIYTTEELEEMSMEEITEAIDTLSLVITAIFKGTLKEVTLPYE